MNKLIEPNARDAEILEAIRWGHSLVNIGEVYGVSKQRIHNARHTTTIGTSDDKLQ